MVQNDKLTQLGTILQKHGVVSASQVREAVWKQDESGKLIGEVLQDLGMATVSQVNAGLTDQKYQRRSQEMPPSFA